jgi:hypothetical protein
MSMDMITSAVGLAASSLTALSAMVARMIPAPLVATRSAPDKAPLIRQRQALPSSRFRNAPESRSSNR